MDLYLAVKSQIGPAVLQSLLQISGNKCQLLHAKASLQNSGFFKALRILILEAERDRAWKDISPQLPSQWKQQAGQTCGLGGVREGKVTGDPRGCSSQVPHASVSRPGNDERKSLHQGRHFSSVQSRSRGAWLCLSMCLSCPGGRERKSSGPSMPA